MHSKGVVMNLEGFNTIQNALTDAEVDATVTPHPVQGEDVRFVTIETFVEVQPQQVLNALAVGSLLEREGEGEAVGTTTPQLRPLGVSPGSITLEDTNIHSYR
jgi:hypothetical protein